MGQTNMHSYMPKLLSAVEEGKIDPSFVISHRLKLSEAPMAYEILMSKRLSGEK